MKKLIFTALAMLTLASTHTICVGALELSLEENRGESGTIGYVDIERVFKEFSGTLNAREEFISEIKKKEETISRRKMAVYTLKAEIAKLKQEKEFALTLPGLLKTREQLSEEADNLKTAAVAVASAAASLQIVQASIQAAVANSTDTTAVANSTDTAAVANSTDTAAASISTDTVAGSTVPPQAVQAPAPAAVPSSLIPPVTPPAAASALPGLSIDMPGISKVPTSHFKFSVSTSVPEIDAAINAKEAELKDKENSLRLYQRQAEVELLEYESHKSELILGRIYLALKELAVREEVSVIVDKRSILFGHSAVNLTDKLLKKLEESPI